MSAAGAVAPPASRMVDVNTLLQVANLVVMALVVLAYGHVAESPYMNAVTVSLGLVLCVQTQVALQVERLRRDPLVIMLAFSMIFYFQLRVFTLAVMPYSVVFDRIGFTPADANFAMAYIVVANLFVYAGFLAVRFHRDPGIDTGDWRAASPRRAILLMAGIFGIAYFGGDYLASESVPRAFRVIKVFLMPEIVVGMALAYVLVFRKSLSRRHMLIIGVLLVLEMAAHTLWGSRSALVYFIQNCFMAAIAVLGVVKFRRRHVLLTLAAAPLLAAVLVGAFAISTYNRLARVMETETQALDIGLAMRTAQEARTQLAGSGVDMILPPVLARAGFFDFSAELIAHRDAYRPVVNLPAYGRSVVDNIMTPGLDFFDQPKIANSLRFVYQDGIPPSKAIVAQSYHSDQLGMYGEFYTLFGYGSLPLFFVLGYALKRTYVRLHADSPFHLAMKRFVLLYVVKITIDSFGIDWIIGDTLPFVLAILLYSPFFIGRRGAEPRKAPGGDVPRPALVPA